MRRFLFYFSIFLILLIFVFRSLLLNMASSLIDWYDYPYIIWVIFQNIQKLKSLDFIHFFNTNAFYPHQMTLLFSDLLLPQSLIALPFTLLTDNPLLVFNMVFLITFMLNFASAYLLWRQIFKNDLIAFLGSLLVVFFLMHTQLGHFQMQSYWPFLLAAFFIFKNRERNDNKFIIAAGIFLAIQFLASVYLAVFLLLSLFIYFFVTMLFSSDRMTPVKKLVIICVIFVIIDGIFIKKYVEVKNNYNIKRSINEYITYSAHLSDYFFSSSINSLIHNLPVITKWNSFNKHNVGEQAVFPGFLISIAAIFGLVAFNKNSNALRLHLDLNSEKLFFLLLLILGLVFSWGPRISFNGSYAHMPAPYIVVYKLLPFVDSIRALARWSFLFYIGIIYFVLVSFNKVSIDKKPFLIGSILILIILEYLPLNINSYKEKYIDSRHELLKSVCAKETKVLLEIPVTHLDTKGGIAEGLKYITSEQLASLYHGCYLINGYSGYDLPDLQSLDKKINFFLKNNQCQKLDLELKARNVNYVKLNTNKIKDADLIFKDNCLVKYYKSIGGGIFKVN